MAPKPRPPIDRFAEKVALTDAGCLEWLAYVGDNGYGRFYLDGRGALAHRWSYEYFVGPIAEGLFMDHLCRNHSCVNPQHLEPVTPAENVRRGISPQVARERARAQTHCPYGHPYTADNTYATPTGRACLTCKRAGARRHYERNRELIIARSKAWHLANPERSRELGREAQRRQRSKRKAA